MKKLNHFVINLERSISEAFKLMDKNSSGAIVVLDDDDRVVGMATDGDIRRFLIERSDLSLPVKLCMNTNFVFASPSDKREGLLKLLDNTIHIIPVLSEDKFLCDVVTSADFPIRAQQSVIARAKSPVRISFGGGGTDLTHYFVKHGGAVMNATIKMYSHASLRKRTDQKVTIYSSDLEENLSVSSYVDLPKNGNFQLISEAIRLIRPEFGFDLIVGSDFPMRSGLGGSAVVLSAIIGCFNEFREDRWDSYEISELAFQAERISLGLAGGWQDQYATVFGGFNFMEFTENHNVVHPLRISRKVKLELEENLILCYTNSSHDSGNIHSEQKKRYDKDPEIQSLVHLNRELTYDMKNMLLKNELKEFGNCLHRGWTLKKSFSNNISNENLDLIYSLAMNNGALGGKLLGAGGGGFFLFYVTPFAKPKLIKELVKADCKVTPVLFDDNGLQTWKVRENT